MATRKPTIDKRSRSLPNPLEALLVNKAEPAHTIINLLGGVRAVSRALGISAAAVTRWQKSHTADDKRGCDGVIPEFRRPALLALAKEMNVRITKKVFVKV
jgi:hypothetical protein